MLWNGFGLGSVNVGKMLDFSRSRAWLISIFASFVSIAEELEIWAGIMMIKT